MARPTLKCTGPGFDPIVWDQRVMLAGNEHIFALKYSGGIFVWDQDNGLKRKVNGKVMNLVHSAMRSHYPLLFCVSRFHPTNTCGELSCVNPEHWTCHQINLVQRQHEHRLRKKAGL